MGMLAAFEFSAGHVLRTGESSYLDECLPAKVASTEWKSLLLHATTGRRPKSPHAFNTALKGGTLYPQPLQSKLVRPRPPPGATQVAFLLTRNPYERLLSAHLDKAPLAHQWVGLPKNATFNQTVHTVATRHTRRGHEFDLFEQHFMPISQVYTWCLPAHSNRTVLWLEAQPLWYAHLVRLGNLSRSTALHGLSGHRAESRGAAGCFFEPPLRTCADAFRPYSAAEEERWLASVGGDHDAIRRSVGALAEHYTPELAAIVTRVFRDDLRNFGYPEWRGPGAPVLGPADLRAWRARWLPGLLSTGTGAAPR